MSSSELRFMPTAMSFTTGNVSDNWRKFKQRIEFYFATISGAQPTDRRKVGILMTALGDEGIEVFNTLTGINEGSSYARVIEAFDAYCNPRKNTVFERYMFFQLVQGSKSVDAFLVELKTQARKCEFAEAEQSKLVRDRLVMGISNSKVRKEMLRDPDLTLESAAALAKAWETSDTEAAVMAKAVSTPVVPERLDINRVTQQNRDSRDREQRSSISKCPNCGYSHKVDKCPATDQECLYCHKPGHFASVCRRKAFKQNSSSAKSSSATNTVNVEPSASAVEAETDTVARSLEILELSALTNDRSQSAWYHKLRVGNRVVKFKIDSGAECNTLRAAVYRQLRPCPALRPSNVRLRPYGDSNLIKPMGEVELRVIVREKEFWVKFFVVAFEADNQREIDNILGLPTIEVIGLVSRTFAIEPEQPGKPKIFQEFADRFDDVLGDMDGYSSLMLKPNSVPVSEKPRRFPFALRSPICEALTELARRDVIEKVEQPTEWLSNILAVTKPNGSLRICLDPKYLNEALVVPKCEIPKCEDIFTELADKRYFTVFDLRDGFWQIKLDTPSSYLTTFNSPLGRFRWKRLVMGISSAPEIFMNRMKQMFGDLSGVYPYFDDLIVAGATEEEHDVNLRAVLVRAREVGVKFNPNKVQYKQETVNYLGFQVSKAGVKPLKKHLRAIEEMPQPADRNGVLRLLGFVRYLSRFLPNLAGNTEAIRALTRKSVPFEWTKQQENEFGKLKTQIKNATDLRFYRPNEELFIQTDSSKSGVGCCLYQKGAPLAYASRALTKTETNYAQIEKELLAVVFSLEKFHEFTYGRVVTVYSDHKPLVSIVKKPIAELTPRLQRLRLRLLRYNFELLFQPGKELYVADTLSRAYLADEPADETYQTFEVHSCSNVSATPARLQQLVAATAADPELQKLKVYLRGGWPKSKKKLSPALQKFRTFADRITVSENLFYFDRTRLIVPNSLVAEMLAKLHEGHLNIQKTKRLARNTLFWLGMSKDIDLFVASCDSCNRFRNNNVSETLKPFPLPTRPWERIHTDILTFESVKFLVLYDAYSQWVELFALKTQSLNEIIVHFKNVFARFGVPSQVVSDNIPYHGADWLSFAEAWGFEALFSSPRYPQSNGTSEKAVAIAKRILQKNVNVQYALLQYRNAPIPHLGYSPAQLLQGRNLRTQVPASASYLQPALVDADTVIERKRSHQTSQKFYYDRGARDLPPLVVGDEIYYKKELSDKQWSQGTVTQQGDNPRSYEVQDAESNTRILRNRRFIRKPVRFRE